MRFSEMLRCGEAKYQASIQAEAEFRRGQLLEWGASRRARATAKSWDVILEAVAAENAAAAGGQAGYIGSHLTVLPPGTAATPAPAVTAVERAWDRAMQAVTPGTSGGPPSR